MNSREILEILSKPLLKEAIQIAKKSETKKGYDTTGLGYQFCVNRFNEVLGDEWGYTYSLIKESSGTFKSGTPFYDLTVEVSIWVLQSNNIRKCVGGHISSVYTDAYKGAITNAFKKTAAFWGVGRQAYEGSLDDDSVYEEELGRKELKDKSEETKPALNFNELKDKMATAKNINELKNRCVKYLNSYEALSPEEQVTIRMEGDKRKTWLLFGEGNYLDEETRGINVKDKREER